MKAGSRITRSVSSSLFNPFLTKGMKRTELEQSTSERKNKRTKRPVECSTSPMKDVADQKKAIKTEEIVPMTMSPYMDGLSVATRKHPLGKSIRSKEKAIGPILASWMTTDMYDGRAHPSGRDWTSNGSSTQRPLMLIQALETPNSGANE